MPTLTRRHAITWIELLAILVILAILLGLLMPAILASRESARRTTCTNNLKAIGAAMHNYHDARKVFPNSAELRDNTGRKTAGGWSFLFKIRPNMEYDEFSVLLGINPALLKSPTTDPLTDPDPAIVACRNTLIAEFICPSNPNKTYEDAKNRKIAFTNYKAMGATCIESLKLCVDPDAPPPYGDAASHPDGAIFPGHAGLRVNDIMDGTSHTFMVVESMDDLNSSWIAGSDATLAGVPKCEYEKYLNSFWAPRGWNGEYLDCASPAIQSLRTYLAFDFRPGHRDAGAYPSGVGRKPAYGASSNHRGVVNHLTCEGAVHPILEGCDYAAYFFAVTRNSNDPPTVEPPLDTPF
jgi:type II secretory pathway pseudopilin PulG